MSCPSPQQLEQLLAQQLSAAESSVFAAHIEAWPSDVRRVLEEMTANAF